MVAESVGREFVQICINYHHTMRCQPARSGGEVRLLVVCAYTPCAYELKGLCGACGVLEEWAGGFSAKH